jgi:hypothetical protein
METTQEHDEKIPMMQKLLDNPFLLLFIGVMVPMVVYVLWGVIDILTIPSGEVGERIAQPWGNSHERNFAARRTTVVEAPAGSRRRHLDSHRIRLVHDHVLHDDLLAHLRQSKTCPPKPTRPRRNNSSPRPRRGRQVHGAG